MSRKPISIVKSVLHGKCPPKDGELSNWCHWKPFDGSNWSEKLGSLEYAYLLAYAISMFLSGQLAERINLRYYLAGGMILSGIMTAAFGMGYFLSIHYFLYYFIIQILTGIVQASGWPSVVTIMGNWFGKGKRGLIMGIWNSHTSLGNMLGSVIAGLYVSSCWGLSFIIPGLLILFIGILVYLFMIPYPEDIGLSNPDDAKEILIELRTNQLVMPKADKSQMLSTQITKPLLPYHDRQDDSAISIWDALKLPNVLAYSVALFFAKLVAYTFLYWLPNYLNRVGSGMDAKSAGNLSTVFDMGGILGGIFAGYISDLWITKVKHSTFGRAGTCALMLTFAAPLMFYYQTIAASHSYVSFVILFMCGFVVNGPYSLITTAVSADLGTQHSSKFKSNKALATVTAIIDGTGSLGAALGPFLTGVIVPTGWSNVFLMLILADLLALASIMYIISCNYIKHYCNSTNTKSHNTLFAMIYSNKDTLLKIIFSIATIAILLYYGHLMMS